MDAPDPDNRFAEITAIVKRRYETGAYGNAHFVLPGDLMRAMRASAPPAPERPSYLSGSLGDLLAIPVVVDDGLPSNAWRLVDDKGEILFEGVASDG